MAETKREKLSSAVALNLISFFRLVEAYLNSKIIHVVLYLVLLPVSKLVAIGNLPYEIVSFSFLGIAAGHIFLALLNFFTDVKKLQESWDTYYGFNQIQGIIKYQKALFKYAPLDKKIVGGPIGILISTINASLCQLEYLLMPEIKKIEHQLKIGEIPVVFIMGHGRSGTTNMHASLIKNEKVINSWMLDMVGQSYYCKILMMYLKDIMTFVLGLMGLFEQKNHGVNINEPLEEPQWLIRGGTGVAAYAMNIGLGAETNFAKHCFNSFNENSAQHMRAMMARSILFQRKQNMKEIMYVGCIVDIFPIEFLFQEFGDLKILYSIRDPKSVFKSFACMYQAFYQLKFDDPKYMQNMVNLYEFYTKKRFEQMLKDAELTQFHDKIWFLDFEDWKSDSKKEFFQICEWLNLGEMSLPARKAEGHKNTEDCFNIISKEKIDKELGPMFEKIIENVNLWKTQFRNCPESSVKENIESSSEEEANWCTETNEPTYSFGKFPTAGETGSEGQTAQNSTGEKSNTLGDAKTQSQDHLIMSTEDKNKLAALMSGLPEQESLKQKKAATELTEVTDKPGQESVTDIPDGPLVLTP